MYTGLSAEKSLNLGKRLLNGVLVWGRPIKEIHCTWLVYVNSHESPWVNKNKPEILWILVIALKTELKYSCGEINCSIISRRKKRNQCKNTWISMLCLCHMHTAHSAQLPAGQWRPHLPHALCILQSHAQMICRTLASGRNTCELCWSHASDDVWTFNAKPCSLMGVYTFIFWGDIQPTKCLSTLLICLLIDMRRLYSLFVQCRY